MAVGQTVPGTWGIGGYNIPDLGITEWLSGGKGSTAINNPAVYKAAGTTQQAYSNAVDLNKQYANYQSGKGFNPIGPTTTSSQQQKSSNPVQQAPSNMNPADRNSWAIANGYTGWDDYLNNQNRGGGGVDYAAQARNEINSGYDNYFKELDNMMGELPGQADTQKGIASNSYNQGVTDINSQKESSLADLNTQSRKNTEQQVKSLRDIGENIGNLMRTGQVMLGTRGAGDSSAANMYSYALTKLGSKQRGGVLEQTRAIENDIQDRVAKLNNVVTSELGKLKTNYDNTVLGITQWLGEQQNAIRQAKANGQIQKGQSLASLSTQLLQTATAALMQAKQEVSNRRSMLEQWAMNNAKDIQGLRANLAEVSNYTAPGVTAGQINGIPTFDAQGNMSASFYPGAGYGSNKEEKKPKYLSQLSNYVG